MPCLNCTSRVLRVFLQGSLLPKPSIFRPTVLRAPLKTKSVSAGYQKFQAFHTQQRRDSSFSYAVAENLSDDEYIPFVDMKASIGRGTVPVGDHERLLRYDNRPPPPPSIEEAEDGIGIHHSCEPEIELTTPIPAIKEIDFQTSSHSDSIEEVEIESQTLAEQPRDSRTEEEDLDLIHSLGLPVAGENIPLKRKTTTISKSHDSTQQTESEDESILKPTAYASIRDGYQQAAESNYASPATIKHTNKWKLPEIEGLDEPSPDQTKLTEKEIEFLAYVDRMPKSELEPWKIQKAARLRKYGGATWDPLRRLSPEAVEGIRALHKAHPEYDTPKIAEMFKVSRESIQRILRSKWRPGPEEAADRNGRWERRGESIWDKWILEGTVKTKKMKKFERRERREKEQLRGRWDKKPRYEPGVEGVGDRFL
ncbi:Required for respiratory growth protein 9 mitochondrial [Rhizina undulata]